MNEKKPLPKKVSTEKFLGLNYANALFMNSREAYRTSYDPSNIFFTFKVVEGEEYKCAGVKKRLIQIHLRTPVRDRINEKNENLDVDIYAYFDEFKEKMLDLIKEMEELHNE